jgi:hypothetical protein
LHIRVQQPFSHFHDLVEQALGDDFGVDPGAFFADRETALWRGAHLFFVINAAAVGVMRLENFDLRPVDMIADP